MMDFLRRRFSFIRAYTRVNLSCSSHLINKKNPIIPSLNDSHSENYPNINSDLTHFKHLIESSFNYVFYIRKIFASITLCTAVNVHVLLNPRFLHVMLHSNMLPWWSVFYIYSAKHIYMYDLWMWPWPTLYDNGSVVLPLVTEILPVSVSLTSKPSEWIYTCSSTCTCIYMHDKSLWILFISLHTF